MRLSSPAVQTEVGSPEEHSQSIVFEDPQGPPVQDPDGEQEGSFISVPRLPPPTSKTSLHLQSISIITHFQCFSLLPEQ